MNSIHGPEAEGDCNLGRRKPLILTIAMTLGMAGIAYINVRAAATVIALTYTSTGKGGLLFLFSWSLVYFSIMESIAKWARTQKGVTAPWLYMIGGVHDFLALGIIALIVHVFYEHSEIEPRAYPLRILLVVVALFSLLALSRNLSKLFRSTRECVIGDRQPNSTVDGWTIMSPALRLLLVVSHIINSTLWTWIVIYYRYFTHSFLEHSSWVMASLWIVVVSCWSCCVAVFFGAYRSVKTGGAGPKG